MVRRKVTLRLNADVVQRAKDAGMNLSYFLEVKLVEHLFMQNTPRERFELSLPRRVTGSQGRRGRPDFATSAMTSIHTKKIVPETSNIIKRLFVIMIEVRFRY